MPAETQLLLFALAIPGAVIVALVVGLWAGRRRTTRTVPPAKRRTP